MSFLWALMDFSFCFLAIVFCLLEIFLVDFLRSTTFKPTFYLQDQTGEFGGESVYYVGGENKGAFFSVLVLLHVFINFFIFLNVVTRYWYKELNFNQPS